MSNVITNKKTDTPKIINREHWLTVCAEELTPILESVVKAHDESKKGVVIPNLRISVGFPSRNALSKKRRIVGQCWSGLSSSDGAHQIFIHPQMIDPMEVAGVVAHEQIHAIYPEDGHQKRFIPTAKGIGLEGKMTATVPGEGFKVKVEPIIEKLGPYPHAALITNAKHKPQSTNLLKVECVECGYVIRTTRKWLELHGAPFCPCKGTEDLLQMIEL